jgi:non-specific serine/threonine protein kinase
MYMGVALFYQGHDERAQAVLEESLPLLRQLNDVWALARALHGLGLVALRRGQVTHALDLLGESLRLALERRDRAHVAECLEALAWAAGAREQPERAARLLGAAEALRRQVGLLRPMPRPGARGSAWT